MTQPNHNYVQRVGAASCIRCDFTTDATQTFEQQDEAMRVHLTEKHPGWMTDGVGWHKPAEQPRWCGGEFVESSDGTCANCDASRERHAPDEQPNIFQRTKLTTPAPEQPQTPQRPAIERIPQFHRTLISLSFVQAGDFKRYADAYDSLRAGLEAQLSAALEREKEKDRLSDLVRYMRAELHEADLITDEEFAALVADPEKGQRVARLESYDDHRKRAEEAEAELTRVKAEHNRLREAASQYPRCLLCNASAEQVDIHIAHGVMPMTVCDDATECAARRSGWDTPPPAKEKP